MTAMPSPNVKRHEVTQRLMNGMYGLLRPYHWPGSPLYQTSTMSLANTVFEAYNGKIYFRNNGNSTDIVFVDVADSLLPRAENKHGTQ